MDVERIISERLGRSVARSAALSGGCIAQARLLTLDDGQRVVAKTMTGSGAPNLDLEGWMLELLSERSSLPVPRVLLAEPDVLVIEYIEHTGRLSTRGDEHAAELLAALHSVTANRYGLERDTLIGPLNQPNTWSGSWPAFYAERRLMHFGGLAMERSGLGIEGMRAIEAVCARTDELVGEASPPSLVHGDVWGGNVLGDGDRVAAFIDPAVHHADAEVELAFTTLFGTFSEAFYRRYDEIRPIRAGFFEQRRDLYLLYPLLVHAALFDGPSGGSYGQRALAIAQRLGRK